MSSAHTPTPASSTAANSDAGRPEQGGERNDAFERWRRRAARVTGIGLSESERAAALSDGNHARCERWKAHLMEHSPAVIFMLKHLELSGCPVKPENIPCLPCDEFRAGGFVPEYGAVALCEGRFFNRTHMEDTLVHELVHLYDHCKFNVDWSNLRHHACSEIRANSLSSDCKFTRELRRGFTAFAKHHQDCVRRRSVVSVRGNPACPDAAAAERAVNEVWDSCFADTRPFDEIY